MHLLRILIDRVLAEPNINSEYSEFLNEYERFGHMVRIFETEPTSSQTVYFPHHSVIQDSISTTHLRVVFNASARTSNGTSLNDHLLTDPKLQTNFPAVLLLRDNIGMFMLPSLQKCIKIFASMKEIVIIREFAKFSHRFDK